MVRLTQSLQRWLQINHPQLIPLIMFGYTELMTREMWQTYVDWCLTEEGMQYLKGGKRYKEEERSGRHLYIGWG